MPHRLLVWASAGLLSLGLFAQTAHAGSNRAVLSVTARVVAACSVATPTFEDATDVRHRCTGGAAPHRVTVDSRDPSRESALAANDGVVTVEEEPSAAGDMRIVTITY